MKIFCAFLFVFGMAVIVNAQCPDRAQLRQRILFLRSSTVDNWQQLKELLPVSLLLEKCPQKNDSVRVLLMQRLGALHYLTGNFSDAVKSTLDAISLLHSPVNTYKDTAFLLRAYNFLQVYYDSLKLVDNKMDAIDSCVYYALLTNAINDEILYNFWQLSTYTLERGDYERCIEYSSIGETLTNKHAASSDSITYITSFFINRMHAQIALGDLATGEGDLNKKISEFRSARFERYAGPFFNQLAEIEIRKRNYEQALRYFVNSVDINRRYGEKLRVKETLNNIGVLYLENLSDPGNGLRYFKEGLNYRTMNPLEAGKDEIETFITTGNIGYAYALLNRFDSSDYYFKSAFDMLGKATDQYSLAAMPMNDFKLAPRLVYIVGLVRLKATAYLKRFEVTADQRYLDESLAIYRAGDRILTKGKASQMDLRSQLFWRKDARKLYEQAINACYIAKRPQEAFEFFERSRAVLLYDEIARNRAMSTSDIQTRSQIESKLLQLRSQLNVTPVNTNESAEIQKNILFLNKQKDRLLSSGKPLDTSVVTFGIFKQKYTFRNETLLEIFSGDTTVFILAITEHTTTLRKINKDTFNVLSNSFIGYVQDPVKCNTHFHDFVSAASQLYHLIFDSLQVEGRLTISPDENYFPFEALVTKVVAGRPVYLINDHAVTYTYSGGFLLLNFNSQQNLTSPLVLGMAPVQFPSFGLASLQGSDESLEKIISRFGASQSAINSKATRAEFLNSFYKYRIVQLYTHGAETGKWGVPVIYFADSALNLFDLIPVNKPATQLVVLSACETAKGKYYKGEGVFSFNRAFAEAGIPSSMVNLWSVDNQSSYRLTELFYKYLSKNMAFDEALRQAKLEFISTSGKEKSLPFYWAATVLAGKSSTLEQAPGISWIITAGIILLAIALVIGLFRYFKQQEPYS